MYLLLVLLLKWVLVGRMTAEKCRRTDLLWRFNNHLWKLLQVGGLLEDKMGRGQQRPGWLFGWLAGWLCAGPALLATCTRPAPHLLLIPPLIIICHLPLAGPAAVPHLLRPLDRHRGLQPVHARPGRQGWQAGARPWRGAGGKGRQQGAARAAVMAGGAAGACPSTTAHPAPRRPAPAVQCWLGEKFICMEPDQLTIRDYVSVCSAVTVVCSTGAWGASGCGAAWRSALANPGPLQTPCAL